MKKINTIYVICCLMLLNACTQSGRRQPNSNNEEQTNVQQTNSPRSKWNGKTVVKMNKKNGVYEVPIEINGSKMFFIFDTGASDITISLTEATFLYKQGTLTDDDFLGTQQYQIADGSISEGTIINLKTVKIGNRTLTNVQASVVHNMGAPLLFGQSALAQFGKVTIDYNRGEITFE
jgi:aspartyl protease family protein